MRAPLARAAALLALALPVTLAAPAAAGVDPTSQTTQLVYVVDTDGDGAGALVLRDLTSRQVRTLLPERPDVYVEDPTLSPDGTQVAFATDRGDAQGRIGIAVIDVDGTGFRRLTTPPASTATTTTLDTSPTYRVATDQLYFSRVTENDDTGSVRGAIMFFSFSTGNSVAFPEAGNAISPDMDPSGDKLAVVTLSPSNDGSGSIQYYDFWGNVLRGVGGFGYDPSWSPDGLEIAWATYGEGFPSGIASKKAWQLSDPAKTLVPAVDPIATFAPTWLPDSRSILFDRLDLARESSVDVWAVDRTGARSGPFLTTGADEVVGAASAAHAAPVKPGTASTYVPATPMRLLDTRAATPTATIGKVGPGDTVRLQVTGAETSAGVVPASATAVVLNVTATAGTASTDVRVYPAGAPVPVVSNLNPLRAQTVPNLVTVALGEGGAVELRNAAGEVHLIADLAGWYEPGAAAAGFAPLDPVRVLDTRSGTTLGVAAAGRVGPGQVLPLKVTGRVGGRTGAVTVPADATAVVLNVTATGASRATDVRAYPAGSGQVPEVSNLNVTPGVTAPNLVVVRVGDNGVVNLRNHSGEVHLIADLAGYYGADGTAHFVPNAPLRFLDTRDGTGAAPITTGPGRHVELLLFNTRGVDFRARAAVLNLTATAATASTDIRAYPASASAVPEVSNLNVARGATRANLAIVKVGGDGVRIRNNGGNVHLIADLAGVFIPAG